ncbi:hypothetical protein PPL_08043 [Heterostelium album PN500]|uniref:Uncharacterized protein n=1 Tax=Heterostelium pallidum (strain ATCC 26659 / Pp 5 / PN500) TaxID=670386 RepID=D3BHN8_HETP5|nr:hypothetical protein PPL_08043 [Heterostelium album PN500]EFA79215.1 hypothetical protein PPL_08043 [Heterostelium album PN500]|eukprot:XP_020431336.1 hypothetical protein PPL_08043 [Heterostelium album PN500]
MNQININSMNSIRIASGFNGYFELDFPVALTSLLKPTEYIEIIRRVNKINRAPKLIIISSLLIYLLVAIYLGCLRFKQQKNPISPLVMTFILVALAFINIIIVIFTLDRARKRVEYYLYCVNSANRNRLVTFEFINKSIIVKYLPATTPLLQSNRDSEQHTPTFIIHPERSPHFSGELQPIPVVPTYYKNIDSIEYELLKQKQQQAQQKQQQQAQQQQQQQAQQLILTKSPTTSISTSPSLVNDKSKIVQSIPTLSINNNQCSSSNNSILYLNIDDCDENEAINNNSIKNKSHPLKPNEASSSSDHIITLPTTILLTSTQNVDDL